MKNRDFISGLDSHQLKLFYTNINDSHIIVDAIFSDNTENYVSPPEPILNEAVKIRIRTAKNNVRSISIISNDIKIPMKKIYTRDLFDFYEGEILSIKETLNYAFLINVDSTKTNFYYNTAGVKEYLDTQYNFKIIPDFKTPDWSKGCVMYQIYIDRFYNGDTTNDVLTNEYSYLGRGVKKADWSDKISNEDVWTFYGGDLQGVIEKLDYLSDMGVEAIYFNPIFVSPSNHKYDTQDYDYVDPHIGVVKNDDGHILQFEKFNNDNATKYIKRTTDKENLEESNKLLIRLIDIAHSKGMKVILDGVFNHCGAFNKWLDREGFYEKAGYPTGAYNDVNSDYRDYFTWYGDKKYDGWWGHDNHPKLNFEKSKELEEYILDVGAKWVSHPFNADGWRLDVAADLGHSMEYNLSFWEKFRARIKEANPDALIIAEHYGDPSPWLDGKKWDTIMNYDAFMEPITWFLTGMEKHSEEFRGDLLCNAASFTGAMRYNRSRMPYQSLITSMNQLSNHDHSRFLTRTNMTSGRLATAGSQKADENVNYGIMYEAIVFQCTWTGCPTLYYGDEVGLTGWTDPDNRRPFPWDNIVRDINRFYKLAIRTYKNSSALRHGSVKMLAQEYGILAYGRFNEDEKIIVILNNNNISRQINIPVWQTGVCGKTTFSVLLESTVDHFNTPSHKYYSSDGFLNITVNKFGSIIIKAID